MILLQTLWLIGYVLLRTGSFVTRERFLRFRTYLTEKRLKACCADLESLLAKIESLRGNFAESKF